MFLFAEYQCGANAAPAEFRLDIEVGGEIVSQLSVGEQAMIDASLEEITVNVVSIANVTANCIGANVVKWLEYGEAVPEVPGAYDQQSLEDLYNDHITDRYYKMAVFELGTDNPNSVAYDLNDIGIVYNMVGQRNYWENFYAD